MKRKPVLLVVAVSVAVGIVVLVGFFARRCDNASCSDADDRQGVRTPVTFVGSAPVVQASTNKLARSPRSGQIHWGVNNAGRRVAYRYLPPVRTAVSPAESNEVATAFSCIAEAYRAGDRDAMLSRMKALPDVVTNMPDRLFLELAEPVRSPVLYEFLKTNMRHPEGIKDFATVRDFAAYERINLDLTLFFGNLSLRRENYESPLVFLDSAVLSHLLLYKNKFHDGGQTELENAADAFIREWHAQIESENGFTRQVMWFQVDLSYALCDEGILTPAAVTARVREFAEDLVNLGYTPKWLSEFDDLSEAVK